MGNGGDGAALCASLKYPSCRVRGPHVRRLEAGKAGGSGYDLVTLPEKQKGCIAATL